MGVSNIDGGEWFDDGADEEVDECKVAEEDVVGGGAHARLVLQGDEGDVVEEGADNAETHLGGDQQRHLLLHLCGRISHITSIHHSSIGSSQPD